MAKPQILTDQELDFLTRPFQSAEYSKDRALELASAGCIAMITEPGDRMAGALARCLGKLIIKVSVGTFVYSKCCAETKTGDCRGCELAGWLG
jgi:hypothetical protein